MYPEDDGDDEETHKWLDYWIEHCGGLNSKPRCKLADTDRCKHECPFRTKHDERERAT